MHFKRETKRHNAVYDFYSYKTRQVTQHVIRSYSTMYTKKIDLLMSKVFDINSATGEFTQQSNEVILFGS